MSDKLNSMVKKLTTAFNQQDQENSFQQSFKDQSGYYRAPRRREQDKMDVKPKNAETIQTLLEKFSLEQKAWASDRIDDDDSGDRIIIGVVSTAKHDIEEAF